MVEFGACACSHAIVFPNANYVFENHIYTEYLSEHVFLQSEQNFECILTIYIRPLQTQSKGMP